MDFLAFVRMLRQSWWIVVLTIVGSLGSTAFFTHTQTPIFQATTTLVVWPTKNMTDLNDLVRSLDTLDRRVYVAMYSKIPSSQIVRGRAQEKLGLSLPQLEPYLINTVVIPDTNILNVSVEGPDPHLTANLANAVAEQAKQYIEESYTVFELKILDRATQPVLPARPNMGRNLSVATVLGLLAGLGLVFVRESIQQLKGATQTQHIKKY